MTAIRQGQVTLFDSRTGDARRAAREARMVPHVAMLITGDSGAFVAIEALGDEAAPTEQLAVRAKRLFKGQRAQLITYYVNETMEG